MGRYLEIAKRSIERMEQEQATQSASSEPIPIELPVTDPYAERMRATLRQISVPIHPSSMVLWLDGARPDLYAELTSRLPDEIHRLWTERAPLEQFEAVLARLVSFDRQCCDLYRAALTEESSGNR